MSQHRAGTKRRRGAAAASVGVGAAVLALSGIWMTSNAAFTAQTDNPGNSWASGTVALTDDDGGSTAMFSESAIAPGDSGSKCLVVTYNGTVGADVKVYATDYAQTNSLGDNLTLTITQGSGGSFGDCTGFTADAVGGTVLGTTTATAFAGASTDFATGLGAWSPSGTGQSKTYKIDWALPAATTDGQGGSVDLGFTWEAQNS
jgi:hypothetical protein